jgi:hypothetical protein
MTGKSEDDPPEAVGITIIRCQMCQSIHVIMTGEDDDELCEMTLDEDEAIKMAAQLLRAVFPSMKVEDFVDKIKANVMH